MRTCGVVVVVLLTACGGGGGDDADAAAGGVDAAACPSTSTPAGFTKPTEVTAAYTSNGGSWVAAGPADFSCLGSPSGESATTMDVTLTGGVTNSRTGVGTASLTVSAWLGSDTTGLPAATAVTGNGGAYALLLPTGALRPTVRVSGTGIDTYTINTAVADQTTFTLDLWSSTETELDALPAFVGITRTMGRGYVAMDIVDCQGRAVANAIATVSTVSAATTGCTEHIAGADTYYFSAAATSLPVGHDQRTSTNQDGYFAVFELPATTTAFVQVWGYVDGQNPSEEEPRLLAELPLSLFVNSAVYGTIEPLRQ